MATPTGLAVVDDDVACVGEIAAGAAAGVGACSMNAVGQAVGNALLPYRLVPLMIQHHNLCYYTCTVCIHEYNNTSNRDLAY